MCINTVCVSLLVPSAPMVVNTSAKLEENVLRLPS